ncbi:helix-turn-helix domain-containing protein [Vibrio sp. S11_S32]|uniref:NadS family protein n=1 Tax=Vibrio sp. S11_S32 TaxID=2720225 RepID=UPI0016809DBC|nr:NadS family protein [Vibrio sp. S11_S32]MBD1577170.1 helix-turn-helix domain-containing protein [Vibrio sp. S11_S32]
MSLFNELKASLEEAVEIKNGNKKAANTTTYEVADVKAIRANLNVSQVQFAKALGTSVDTVKSWENKRRNPTGLAAKALLMIRDNPSLYLEFAAH